LAQVLWLLLGGKSGAATGCGFILSPACSIDHDCFLDECVQVSPGARLAGTVRVLRLRWIGIGASVNQSINIGCNINIDAGTAFLNHLTK